IIFVSHDRYFINKITDQVAEMQQDGITLYLGDYDYYIEKKQEEAEIEKLQQSEEAHIETQNEKKLSYKEEKLLQREQRKKERKIEKLEENIETIEHEIDELEQKMTEPKI